MYNDNDYYLAEQQMGYINGNSWQCPRSEYIDYNSYLSYTMNNEQKSNEENISHILKTALTYGSAVALKSYQADSSENYQVTTSKHNNDNECLINSTSFNNEILQYWNNAEKAETLLSSSSQKPMIPTIYNNHQISSEWNGVWCTHAEEANSFSSLSSNHQQIAIPLTLNNSLSPKRDDTNIGEAKSNSSSSSNIMPYRHESSERYQQQNVQNNWQNHMPYAEFNNYINNIQHNTCIGPLTVSNPVMQCELTQHAIHRIEQKSGRGRKKKKLTYADTTLEQERRTRQTYSAEQTLILEQAFRMNEYLSKQMRKILVQKTNLRARQIKIWFQNRRMKEKKNNQARISKTNTASIHESQESTLSSQEAQPQLQPAVQHHERYQNYSYHQPHQQNCIINQSSYFSNSAPISNINENVHSFS